MTRHSVILACYNGAQYISEAIESVLSQLGSGDELIVVDDGSTDDSIALVRAYGDERIRVLTRPKNGGIAAARNDALQVFQGDFVSFIDHDDRWGEGRIKDFESIIAAYPEAEVVHGQVAHFYENPALADQYRLPETQAAVLPGSVCLSSNLVKKIGQFDTALTCGEFVDYMARAKLLCNHWKASDTVYLHRRIHGNNYTLTHAKDSTGYLSVVRAHLLRRQGNSHE